MGHKSGDVARRVAFDVSAFDDICSLHEVSTVINVLRLRRDVNIKWKAL